MRFFTSGLTTEQLDVIKKTGGYVSRLDFYLGGGTALSIYFGHRRSVDLDWFTQSSMVDPMGFAQSLRQNGVPLITEGTGAGTLHGVTDHVRQSFLEYHYPLLQPLVYWEEGNCYLGSLDDLACMKLVAITQRGSRKDFIDIFVLVERHRPIKEMLELYQKKYQTDNIAPVLMSLVYFDDAEEEPTPDLWTGKWEEVKEKLQEWVRAV